MELELNKQHEAPLYMQLADQLIAAIDGGEYTDTDRLPTESELVEAVGVSKGTIKAAYSYMENLGYVKKIRGSGVYVSRDDARVDTQAILNSFFKELELQDTVSYAQAYALFREHIAQTSVGRMKLHVAVVDCNAEMLDGMVRQLEGIEPLVLLPYTTGELFTGDNTISPLCKLVITTQLHFEAVMRYAASFGLSTEQVAVVESRETVRSIYSVPADQAVCVIYRSVEFLQSVRYSMRVLQAPHQILAARDGEVSRRMLEHAAQGHPFLLPADYRACSSAKTLEVIERARKRGSRILPFVTEIDAGSMLHLREKVELLYAAQGRGRL